MELRDYPEWNETVVDENLFQEREKDLPKNTQRVREAQKYFLDIMTKAFHESINIQDINTGYVYILNDCIAFAKNKEKYNEKIKKWLNEDIYDQMTWRRWYSWTLSSAENLVQAFFNPKVNAHLRSIPERSKIFLNRDSREQAYRICDYVLKYMKWYAEDDRLKQDTQEQLHKILWMQSVDQ